ncbi:hypothetical protein MAUB1S_08392 [Mycolicibacterium aubagnense]
MSGPRCCGAAGRLFFHWLPVIEATGKLYLIEETELGFRVIGHVK